MSKEVFTDGETELMCLGMSFCPTPKSDLDRLNNDLYEFTRKLRLKFHFRDSRVEEDISIVKLPSKFTPPPYTDIDLETMINKVKHLYVTKRKRRSNLSPKLQTALLSLMDRITKNQIIIKSADKGDVTVVMSRQFYLEMCMNELSKTEFYKNLGSADPSKRTKKIVKEFAEKHKDVLTPKEFEFLVQKKYRMAYFYCLPKLHKSEEINNVMNTGAEYVHLDNFNGTIEGRPIVGGPCFFTSGLSEMLDIILKPIVTLIPHILRDSFDFVDRCEKMCEKETLFGTCDIKSLYTNLSFELVLKSVEYWISKYSTQIPLLDRFNVAFICEALKIILENNFFEFNDSFIQQIKGFAMGTKAAVQCANLAVAYLEVKMFAMLPTIYPQDFVDFIIRNYFRLLDDIIHAWLAKFDVTQFYEIFDSLDENLKFIFSVLAKNTNFLDISLKVDDDDHLIMDIYHKPTDSHNYLNYKSSHPKHTRDNIALSLAKRIIRIVSDDRQHRLSELKRNLILRDHPERSINHAFSRVMEPRQHSPAGDLIVFTSTFDPNVQYNRRVISNIFDDLRSDSCRKAFKDCRVVVGTRQPKALRNYLISSKFSSRPPPRKNVSGLFKCRKSCVYHSTGLIKPCKMFRFGKHNQFSWKYTRFFNCDSKNVIYVLKCSKCWKFYIGETKDLKVRTRKHKSDVKHLHNSSCKKLALHLRTCSKLRSPFFHIYPIYYVEDQQRRRFLEKRFVKDFKPPLNDDE